MVADRIRHTLGVAAFVVYGPGLLFWVLIHPWAQFWRRLGPTRTYMIVGSALAGLGGLMYRERGLLLGRDFGMNRTFTVIGAVCFGILGLLGFVYGRRMQHLSPSARMGVPELSNTPQASTLVTDGLYRIVRHPIYTYGVIAGFCFALIINHQGTYILFAVTPLLLYLVALLEERELTARFGETYRQYQREVPRFVPKWRKRS